VKPHERKALRRKRADDLHHVIKASLRLGVPPSKDILWKYFCLTVLHHSPEVYGNKPGKKRLVRFGKWLRDRPEWSGMSHWQRQPIIVDIYDTNR